MTFSPWKVGDKEVRLPQRLSPGPLKLSTSSKVFDSRIVIGRGNGASETSRGSCCSTRGTKWVFTLEEEEEEEEEPVAMAASSPYGMLQAGMYPVDVLEDDPDTYQEAALAYYASLREGAGASSGVFCLPTGEKMKLEASYICFCMVHRDEPQRKIPVLVNSQDAKTVVAVYIKESLWSTEDALRTSDPAREGLMKVQSFGERIVLFILNVIIFGRLERNLDDDDMFFLPHSVKEQAKILWRHGTAVGFYTTKMKGSLCGDGTGTCYLLPIFDTVFIRRKHWCQGLGTAMLWDFCETFPEDEALGVSCLMSPAMYQVCRQFLLVCLKERGSLWEVEPLGAWGQHTNVWLKVQLHQAKLPDCE
ncbi:protein FAM169B [Chlorocebus sabaeus]|uniref:protein FAM169B n=1 Tax=Chlorocebus sabaeus TaxID=60711 RepID=UPI003BF967E5